MKTLNQISVLYILILIISGFNNSSEIEKKYDGSKPMRIVITGKVLNPIEDIYTVSVILNDPPTARQLTYTDDINPQDSTFHISFERYLPQDVMIKYGTLFKVFVHPGDSLHIEFDANQFNSMSQIYENLKFSGSPAEFNELLAIYYSHYLQYQPDFYQLYEFQQTCTAEEIIHIRDSIRQSYLNYFEEFKNQYHPSEELKTFIEYDIEMDYANNLAMYPAYYARTKNLKLFEVVPFSFYDFLDIPLPKKALINTNASRNFINRYRFGYVFPRLHKKLIDKRAIIDTIINGKPKIINNIDNDSAKIYYTIEITKDPMVLQLSLCEDFSQNLSRMSIKHFDSFRPVFDQYITEPFLRDPLLDYYNQVKLQVQNPGVATNAIIKDLKKTNAENIFEQILDENKGKVIYLDVWAVWCAPCRSEMPRSIELMKKLDNNDISFVYLCIDSEEKGWKALLSELQLEGFQYFADKNQSAYLRKALSISGVPHYILIDKEGNIIEKGSHLRPSNEETYENIQALLSE